MKYLFANFYQPEEYLERINKKCCKNAARYLIKCPSCQGMFCISHVYLITENQEKKFGCLICSLKQKK